MLIKKVIITLAISHHSNTAVIMQTAVLSEHIQKHHAAGMLNKPARSFASLARTVHSRRNIITKLQPLTSANPNHAGMRPRRYCGLQRACVWVRAVPIHPPTATPLKSNHQHPRPVFQFVCVCVCTL